MAESATDAIMRAAQAAMDVILEPITSHSPVHELVPGVFCRLDGEWTILRRVEAGRLVVSRPDSSIEWTYLPEAGESIVVAAP